MKIRATKQGKLYIKTSDFFKEPKIKKMIKKLLNCSITKEIDSQKYVS